MGRPRSTDHVPHPEPIVNVLAANLQACLDARPATANVKTLSARMGIGTSTIHRILNAETAAGIDTVAHLAAHLKLQPWQLLVHDLDPAAPPALAGKDANQAAILRSLRRLSIELEVLRRLAGEGEALGVAIEQLEAALLGGAARS